MERYKEQMLEKKEKMEQERGEVNQEIREGYVEGEREDRGIQ